MSKATLLCLALMLCSVGAWASEPVDDGTARYSYYYEGELIVLQPSEGVIALQEPVVAGPSALVQRQQWRRDPLSDRYPVKVNDFNLYRFPRIEGKQAALTGSHIASAFAGAREEGVVAQPVFELGGAIKIPSDEVIVSFKGETSLEKVKRFLNALDPKLGLGEVRHLRKNAFIVKIADSADGRAFAVSRSLSVLPGVSYAEPNCIILFLDREADRPFPSAALPSGSWLTGEKPLTALGPPAPVSDEPMLSAPPGWTTLLSEGFEGDTVGAGWGTLAAPNATQAIPIITNMRANAGTNSLYMTGGGPQGRLGLYPDNCNALLVSPTIDLAAYEEVYVEVWFYAKYENPNPDPFQPYDFGLLVLYDPAAGDALVGEDLLVPYAGDLTADPTTKSGWRRMLYRVPPAWRRDGVRLVIQFVSDESNGAEGLYVDDFRVVGASDVDTQSISIDPYSSREYELKNSGQIAALGDDTNDLNVPEAWAEVTVSPDIVVAIIDSGVEPHPDLNLVTGYDADTGLVGGVPKTEDDNHGQACVGNIGAIGNNAIGVVGTAPGVKIMPIYFGSTEAGVANAFDLSVSHGARVLSNSWGWVGAPSATITGAIHDALAAGRVVLFAAGNGPDRPPWSYQVIYPGNLTATTDVICVGASSPTDEHKNASSSDGEYGWGSSYVGDGPDVVAPGPWSYTTDRPGIRGYNQDAAETGVDADYSHDFSGTSSSTPKVAGIVALILSKNPSLSPAQVKMILRSTAKDIDAPGFDDRTGAGRVDALGAIRASGGTDYTLSVTRAGTGTGTVTSAPSGINCGSDCSETYAAGTEVTLDATPDASVSFWGFDGDDDCLDGAVTMSADKACEAMFVAINPNLQVQVIGKPYAHATGKQSAIKITVKIWNRGAIPVYVTPTILWSRSDLAFFVSGPSPTAKLIKPQKSGSFKYKFKAHTPGDLTFFGYGTGGDGVPSDYNWRTVTIVQ